MGTLSQYPSPETATPLWYLCIQTLRYPAMIWPFMSMGPGPVSFPSFAIEIYDTSGNKVSGSDFPFMDASVSATTRTVSLASPLELNPGIYYVAIAEDTASVTVETFTGTVALTGSPYNANVVRTFTAGNSLSAGVMPSSLGARTVRSAGTVAIVLEP
jgi:hypothetical protein